MTKLSTTWLSVTWLLSSITLSQGQEVKQDELQSSEKAPIEFANPHAADCNAGDPDACLALGMIYEAAPNKQEAAVELYQQACNQNHPLGCLALATKYEDRENYRAARGLFGRSCRGGQALACSKLASLHQHGLGGLADLAAAEALFEKACSAGEDAGCLGLEDRRNKYWTYRSPVNVNDAEC